MEKGTAKWSSPAEAWKRLAASDQSQWRSYLGFYSSWLGGYFREPWAMLIPMDDHGFHRGDGVFEAVRIQKRAYFDLRAHLLRLESSAAKIGIALPKSLAEIENICVELARLCDSDQAILRLYITRGPGGFSPSPNECVGSQLYAAVTQMRPPNPQFYETGSRAMISRVAAKEPMWAQIKSCNYLQNVLMKKECAELGYDFAISVDSRGRLCEGSTENLLFISAKGELIVPPFDYTLRGTTVRIVMSLAQKLIVQKQLAAVKQVDTYLDDLKSAREVAFVGTTLGVLPVTSLDGEPLNDGKVGPICRLLHGQLIEEMEKNSDIRTPF